jgi:GGDEF domain-containing protein
MPMFYFTRLTLIQKMIISYVVSGFFLLAALIYSVASMNSMLRIQEEIARNDLTAATVTISLHEILLAQERYVGKYQILHQQEFRDLYEQNSAKFLDGLTLLRQVSHEPAVAALVNEYARYADLIKKLFADQNVGSTVMREAADRMEKAFVRLRTDQQYSLDRKLKESDEKASRTIVISIGLAIGGVSIAFLVAFLMIYSFATSIRKLQRATHRIADGDFDHEPGILPGDEIGALAQDFSRMAVRLKQLEQISLDASPLTRLPGNIAIERTLNRRLREKVPFVMCYIDLDNFKSYNDRYGYIKASELIKEAGRLIYEAVHTLHDPEAFVGHIGGDDFVVIITSDKAEAACRAIISDFDAMIPAYYSDEDRFAGAINGIDRYGVPRLFPLVSMSIAALDCRPGDYATAAEIATAAAEVKDHVKGAPGSNFIIIREAGCYET